MATPKASERWRSRIVGQGEEAPDHLLANPLNWRTHPKAQQDALAGAITELGWIQQVIVNRTTGHVVDGHARIGLALSRNEPSVPVLYVDLSEDEERLALLTLDPIAAMAAADKQQLDSLLREVQTGDAAIQAMLADLAKGVGLEYGQSAVAEDAGPQLDRAAELQAQWGTALGQLWEIPSQTVPGRCHRLLCGDSTDAASVARLMAGERADCVFTSPPYALGVAYGEYEDTVSNLRALLPRMAAAWHSVLLPGGFAVVNFNDVAAGRGMAGSAEPCEYPMALEHWPVFREAGYLLWSRRIWCKPNPRVHSPWCIQSNRAASDWEHIWTWRVPGEPLMTRVDGEYRSASGWIDTSQMQGVDVGKETHGAGTAVGIAVWMLLVHSRVGAGIHEPFAGTGTTLVAAEQTQRVAYGAELHPPFVAVTLQRLAGLGLQPRLVEAPC